MFKKLAIEQDTEEWLEWRMTGITATEAAIVSGVNPYESVDKFFPVKAGFTLAEFKYNEAIRRGKALEPFVRQMVNIHFNTVFEPACVQNLKNEVLIASLDGINQDGSIILEIKCATNFGTHRKNFSTFSGCLTDGTYAIIYNMPEYYYCQLQYQLMVTQASKALFVSYFEGDMKFLTIYPEAEYQKSLKKQVINFWKKVQKARKNGKG